MPRFFRPVGGFADRSISAVRIDDDGSSHHVRADGKDSFAGYVDDKTQQARSTWALSELENLMKGGTWEEFSPDAKPADVQTKQPTKPTRTVSTDSATIPVIETGVNTSEKSEK